MRLASKTYDLPDVWAAQELYHANGWTDGLPIVPPTRDAVAACLEMTVADPAQLVGVEPVRGVAVTTEKLAIDAVMAGCLPTHFSGRESPGLGQSQRLVTCEAMWGWCDGRSGHKRV